MKVETEGLNKGKPERAWLLVTLLNQDPEGYDQTYIPLLRLRVNYSKGVLGAGSR